MTLFSAAGSYKVRLRPEACVSRTTGVIADRIDDLPEKGDMNKERSKQARFIDKTITNWRHSRDAERRRHRDRSTRAKQRQCLGYFLANSAEAIDTKR